MRKVKVYRNKELAGELIQENPNSYLFRYTDSYLSNDSLPAISLTLPKSRKEYRSECLFPFFYNLLSEGVNRKLQCRLLKIDEKDFFGLLMETAKYDTAGPITLKPFPE
ncbi:MAG: phosphatidylinositol kinase [Bacteroidetes bacterium RBG_13_43_22]|nr:MAG: phosphatidylinositol kinase [Bacteroidetes bacterium RBG_13_43_22]OFY78542.1 MAG: phosphatidylinositol kinase [Bacteroidetes bacterium RBG_19FT_COMBO_42_7]